MQYNAIQYNTIQWFISQSPLGIFRTNLPKWINPMVQEIGNLTKTNLQRDNL